MTTLLERLRPEIVEALEKSRDDYDYSITGIVVKGNHLGHQIGFPTANIKVLDSYKLIPANGVYGVRVNFKEYIYKGMLNIGMRPTIGGTEKTIEVHIIDFERDLYGEELTIYIDSWIREEAKFEHIDALKLQLEQDKRAVLNS